MNSSKEPLSVLGLFSPRTERLTPIISATVARRPNEFSCLLGFRGRPAWHADWYLSLKRFSIEGGRAIQIGT
jgi:hypothetical protein